MVDKILVPLDGTDFAEYALGTALAIARRSGAPLALATAEVPPPMAFPDVNFLEPLEETERSYLESVADRIREAADDVDVTVEVVTGNVPEALELHRKDIGADLTVMTSHGRGPMARAWLGSVADHFVRSTGAPVLVVRPAEGAGSPDLSQQPAFHHVAITLDGSELSETAIDPGMAMADLFDAAVTLVRVVEYPHQTESIYMPDAIEAIQEQLEESREAAHAELERVATRLTGEGREVGRESRVVNHAAPGILEVVEELGADLVVMASHGRGGLGRAVLGSVTDKVLRACHGPVLVVRA